MPKSREPDRLSVAFARILRGAGLDVPVGATVTYAEGLAAVGLDRRDGVYWAGRVTLVSRPEDVGTYDDAFAAFWDGATASPIATIGEDAAITIGFDSGGD